MIEVKAPNKAPTSLGIHIFLAGSIEMGVAEAWQERIVNDLRDEEGMLFNPRRDNWDSSWKQTKTNPQFSEQVNWELDYLTQSDLVIFYFDPGTKSPVTLMELGYMIGLGKMEIVVCCPDGFWRKGNVEILCDGHNVPVVNTYDELIIKVKAYCA